MSKSNSWENDLLNLVFNNVAASGIGDTIGIVGSTGVGSLYVSLHTADPTATGNQSSNEATYTGYARVAVARTSAGWAITTGPVQVANVATITYPMCTGGTNTIAFVGIGTSSTGTGKLLYSGALSSTLAVSNNITPAFSSGQIVLTES